ncbi:MAG: putative selenate reductase subunit YgfK [Clostridiales bacterium]|jgi:putative selenate reductase|nr:putative selenate reductase subunit YgfK [Clostridiales bacterium]
MSEEMHPLSFQNLAEWALSEYKASKSIFGIRKFYRGLHGGNPGRIRLAGKKISVPFGPAAGPHTQLAENIVSAWLCGSRFIELKTVQKIDGGELRACVPRPCISAEDEGYNVEWSTELAVSSAYEEYAKAWLLIHALAKELEIEGGSDVIFNMSVGYDLEGVKSEKIDKFIECMKDASSEPFFIDSVQWLENNLNIFMNLKLEDIRSIPSQISNSATISTLHGCPPDEIEAIAMHLINEKRVHTYVKMNPTILGYDAARRLLDENGFGYIDFDERHFKNDLKREDAVPMLGRLMEQAGAKGLSFGVKLTNTFPVKTGGLLPGEEMYMSGRALFPLSASTARMLAEDFDGRLSISYSGGADINTIKELFEAGIAPVTAATAILKPGGYERLNDLAEAAERASGSQSQAQGFADFRKLDELCSGMKNRKHLIKGSRPSGSRKTSSKLPLFDCFKAPCAQGGCPIEQQVPEYLQLAAEGKFMEAFAVISSDNTSPSITGALCPQFCQGKCARLDYDEPLAIRKVKRAVCAEAQSAFTELIEAPQIATAKKALIIGAGPAGIAAATFLRRAGMRAVVAEKRGEPFGAVSHFIPEFRISRKEIMLDYNMAVKTGVEFMFGIDGLKLAKDGFDYIIAAAGAWGESPSAFEGEAEGTIDALEYLKLSKEGRAPEAKRIAVLGGGDVAMDCARVALRSCGVCKVSVIYRRTREFMTASPEELESALSEGAELLELLSPAGFDGSRLRLRKMMLGSVQPDGRKSSAPTGEEEIMEYDLAIQALGARIDPSVFSSLGLNIDNRGFPLVNEANESNVAGVYVIGDCKSGPRTIVEAIADAKVAVADICRKEDLSPKTRSFSSCTPLAELYRRKGVVRKADDAAETASESSGDGKRCLGCGALCEICADVCPNRANISIVAPGFEKPSQIIHMDALCNECGNCKIFCPHQGDPCKDKLTLFDSLSAFRDSTNPGLLFLNTGKVLARRENGEETEGEAALPDSWKAVLGAVAEKYSYLYRFR